MNDVAVRSVSAAIPARPVTPSTILAKELGELCRELEASGVDLHLLRRLQRAANLAGGLDPYLDKCTTPESPALAELARRTRETDWATVRPAGSTLEQEMLSGHVEGQLLKFLLHMADAKRVLEIGMFTGYSALAMAEALPADGTVVACELDPGVAGFARDCFDDSPVGHKITVEVGPAMDTLRRLDVAAGAAPRLDVAAGAAPRLDVAAGAAPRLDVEFDFVFIDADKPGYLGYVEFLLDSTLLSPRAVIAIDNTLLQGEPYADGGHTVNGSAIAEFNAALTYDRRVEQVLLPLRDGLTLIRRTAA